MKIDVKYIPEEHWYFMTPRGRIWLSAWGNGVVDLHKYFHTNEGHSNCKKANDKAYEALRKMFRWSK